MRFITSILALFIYSNTFAQTDSVTLSNSILALKIGLLQKDSVILKAVLHDKLSYGHSNGWIEKKAEVIGHLHDGTLTYTGIEEYDPQFTIVGDIALVRMNPDINVSMNGTALPLKLHVLQVWMKTNRGWQLISRQSTKI
jgi:hypothetical protein